MSNELFNNLDKIHSTDLGVERIKKNLNINPENVIEWCKGKMQKSDYVFRRGKNWYVHVEDLILTINAHSFTIITAHKNKAEKLTLPPEKRC